MKPTEDVSQFPEKGMSTPEYLLSFNHHNREIFRITHDARMICGEGLSTEEATQEAAKLLIQAFEQEIQKMLDARAAAELVTMNVPRREKAEADTARLDWLEANPEAIRAYSIHKSTFGRKVWWETGFGNYHTAREAVDAAMKEASK